VVRRLAGYRDLNRRRPSNFVCVRTMITPHTLANGHHVLESEFEPLEKKGKRDLMQRY
jgi:hypothetical protein